MRLDAWLKTMRTHLQLLEHDDWNSQTSIGTRCVVIFSLQLLSITFGVFFALHHYRHLDLCTFLGTKYFQILFGLTKHTHTIYLPSLLRLGMVAFVVRMFVRAAARCVRTSCTQNLTDIRNQFSARIFFIHRLKVLFTVVQWNFASLDLSCSLGRKLYYAFISCFIGIYWKRHVHHLPVSVDILYTIQSRVSRSVGWLIGNVIAFLLLLLERLPSIIEYGRRDEQIPIHTFYVPSMRALDFFCHFFEIIILYKNAYKNKYSVCANLNFFPLSNEMQMEGSNSKYIVRCWIW